MSKSSRILAAILIVLAGVALVLVGLLRFIDNKYVSERDFIAYWAAGRLIDHGQNPYDFQAVKTLEVAAGRDPSDAMFMMRNPPDALFLALPLGFAQPKTDMIVWFFVMIAILLAVGFMIWRLNDSPENRIHLLGFAFAPVLICLMNGQVGIVMLLGIVLFLYLQQRRPFLAGASLLLCAIKPHLFGPFWVVLLVSCAASRKSWRILAGFMVAIAANCALVYALDPHSWSQYSHMMHAGGALNEPIPVLSVVLRSFIDPGAVWIQFVPAAVACVWAAWYFWSRRLSWDWMDHGLLMLLVGVMCSPFGWVFDESVVLPAVLAGIYQALASRRSIWPIALIAGAALAELMMSVPIKTHSYLWTTPMWLFWYLYATGRLGKTARQPAAASA